jgi:hypothetical protein
LFDGRALGFAPSKSCLRNLPLDEEIDDSNAAGCQPANSNVFPIGIDRWQPVPGRELYNDGAVRIIASAFPPHSTNMALRVRSRTDVSPRLEGANCELKVVSVDARHAAGHRYTTTAASRSAPHQADARSNHQSCRRCGNDEPCHSGCKSEHAAYDYRRPLHFLAPR